MGYLKLNELLEKRLEVLISFQNLTSNTAPITDIKLISLGEKSCSVSLSNKSCALSHQVLLRFVIRDLSAPKTLAKEIALTGKITEKNATNEQTAEITILFQQYLKEEWKIILDLYENKQNFINEILDKLKNSNE